ncbi:MAG TPA: tyrosinase family protein [Marinagarivorans sp.]
MNIDRRSCIKLAGGSVASAYTLGVLGGCESLQQQIENRPVRRDISTLSNNHPIVEAYRDGVAQMKALPNSDRRNWARQAQIHQNFCPHGNWYFLPWHRAYLFYFETIIRELSGYAEFALPYWNWTCSPQIPPHFFGAGNTLLDNTRTKGPSDSIPTNFTGQDVLTDILAIPDFETFGSGSATALRGGGGFYGELEGTPHNLVHGWVRGNMGGLMSPLDPVFWCHHNMIERCWWDWNITQGKNNPSSSSWTSMSLANMFCDKDGNLVSNLTVGITALYPVLSYQFDDQLFPCDSGIRGLTRSTAELREFLQRGGPSQLNVLDRIAAPTPEALLVQGRSVRQIELPVSATQMVVNKSRATQRVVLKVKDARLQQGTDAFVRVFINPPSDINERSVHNRYYAGSFAFFGDGTHGNDSHHGGHNGNTYHIDITNTVQELIQKGVISERSKLNISLTAVSTKDGKSIPQGNIAVSGIEVLLSDGFAK